MYYNTKDCLSHLKYTHAVGQQRPKQPCWFVSDSCTGSTTVLSLICCSDPTKAVTYTETKGLALWRWKTYITYHFVECLEGRLLVIMVDTSIAMQNRDTFFFCTFTVASIHTVVRTVVPLAWKHIETLCQCQKGEKEQMSSRS